jgi:hypothetical protein
VGFVILAFLEYCLFRVFAAESAFVVGTGMRLVLEGLPIEH